MRVPIWGMLPFAIFLCTIVPLRVKWLEATSRVDVGHISGPKSQVSIGILVRLLLAMAMEI